MPRAFSTTMQLPNIHQVGHYLVTPITRATDCGQFLASVSIRRGMHDRVFRFIPLFDSAGRAGVYALAQGRLFVQRNELV